MVICSECGTRVSPKVLTCPKCNAPVDATGVRPKERKLELPPWWMMAVGLLALVAVGYASYLMVR